MNAELLKSVVRPPFANYGLVVYFGVGLFALPFLNIYVAAPLGISVRDVSLLPGIELADSVISTLVFLFSAYVFGHAISYFSSKFIQQFFDLIFGKTSSIVFLSAHKHLARGNAVFRSEVNQRIKGYINQYNWPANAFRLVVHFWAIPVYILVYYTGAFGFYYSRVTKEILQLCRVHFEDVHGSTFTIGTNTKWFKPLEHWVMNNSISATARMYNYLVIAGFFRSLSLLFLCAIWGEWLFIIHEYFSDDIHPGILLKVGNGFSLRFLTLTTLYLAYIFSIFSFLKFQRRYVEEAIFCFALSKTV